MICKVCGREIANENANFCEYCGASVRDTGNAGGYAGSGSGSAQGNPVYGGDPAHSGDPAYSGDSFYGRNDSYRRSSDASSGKLDSFLGRMKEGLGYPGEDTHIQSSREKEPVIGFGNWMITMLLPLIPMVGPLIYLVMLFVWAFAGTNRTKKNWARATLIMLLLSIFMLMSVFSSIMPGMTESMLGENLL